MNLRNLSDDQLLERTEVLVHEERELLTKVLHHLREIDSRRLFSKLKYKSLFDYAVKHLKYSADQAARRISAMRMLREMPEIEEKIEQGSLTLSNLSVAHSLFRNENFSRSDKTAFIEKIANKSSREAEKIAVVHSSSPMELKRDRIRPVTPNHVEIKFIASDDLTAKMERLKGLLAHKNPGCGLAELVNTLCDIALEKLVPKPNSPGISRSLATSRGHRVRKSIPNVVRRAVWEKAHHKCEECDSTHALEVDHVRGRAFGGTDDLNNLRLLCRHCNQRSAIEQLGLTKMQQYLEPATPP